MAGIGFVLRRLSKQNNLIGLFQAYTHSALAAAGPWLFTVVAIGLTVSIGANILGGLELFNFQIVIIYNFSFSLVLSGPIILISTRFLADKIYCEDVSGVPGMMIGSIFIIYLTQSILVIFLYIGYADFSPAFSFSAIANFLVISGIWLLSVFLSALKDYKTITISFLTGLSFAVVSSLVLGYHYGGVGMLNGFTLGLALILASLTARVYAEYPYGFKEPFAFLPYFKKYWPIALGGFVYNAAIWVDKWIMWFAPGAKTADCNLVVNPDYDSAMFLAYLTIVPAMASFVFSMETEFYEHYLRFYRDIQNKATFDKINQNHIEMIKCIYENIAKFVLLQGSICFIAILMAPQMLSYIDVPYTQIGIFRFGVLGVFYQIICLFMVILLSYFDNRKAALSTQIVFLFSNALCTIVSAQMGFRYYGAGYCVACMITLVYATIVTAKYVKKLPYHTFITANTSVDG